MGYIHALVPEGIFLPSGTFCPIDTVTDEMFRERWEEKVFAFLKKEGLLSDDDIDSMKKWKHSGFSVNTDVRIPTDDKEGMMRLIQYIVRCPFSLERMVNVTENGKVVYRAGKGVCHAFPIQGDVNLKAGTKRNFEIFEPLDFLAEVTQHIPKHGQHQLRMYPRAYVQKRKQVFCFTNMAGIHTKRWGCGISRRRKILNRRSAISEIRISNPVIEVMPVVQQGTGNVGNAYQDDF